jgi:hypothetical protein
MLVPTATRNNNATAPDLAYNQTANEYLVAWWDHGLDEYEAFEG